MSDDRFPTPRRFPDTTDKSVYVRCILGFLLLVTAPALHAQALSFEQARARLLDVSHALKAVRANEASKIDTADSLKSLDLPTVSIDAEYLRYRKTISDDQKVRIDNATVNGVPIAVDPLNNTPFDATLSQTALRSVLTATWPLYTGGRITATQQAARAIADQAGAMVGTARDTLTFDLVRAYYGQCLAERVADLKRQLRDGMQMHLDNALAMERHGMLTRAQRLQAEVALHTAQRGHDSAIFELTSAQTALSTLLLSDRVVQTSSQLFVLDTAPVGERSGFADAARRDNPQLQQLEALKRAADENINVARARWKPHVFAFGTYNLNRKGETPLDPDWLAGVGVSWPLFASIDRAKSVSAATNTSFEALNALEDARIKLDAATRQAFDAVQDARRQYIVAEANQQAATESLRVQEVAFREGLGTSTDVTDARVALTAVLVEQAAAAYRFDVELARLLHASGRIDRFSEYADRADKVIP